MPLLREAIIGGLTLSLLLAVASALHRVDRRLSEMEAKGTRDLRRPSVPPAETIPPGEREAREPESLADVRTAAQAPASPFPYPAATPPSILPPERPPTDAPSSSSRPPPPDGETLRLIQEQRMDVLQERLGLSPAQRMAVDGALGSWMEQDARIHRDMTEVGRTRSLRAVLEDWRLQTEAAQARIRSSLSAEQYQVYERLLEEQPQIFTNHACEELPPQEFPRP